VSIIAYVNGRYLPHRLASVHVEDRGYQFADGVYEVCEIRQSGLVDEPRHLERLERSLAAVRIAMPMSRQALSVVMREVVRRNRIQHGLVYLQVTRGTARRDHAFPAAGVKPNLVVTARALNPEALAAKAKAGIAILTVPDTRWARVDIKTVGLLSNVLARQAALEAGAAEAWFVDATGYVTEGASTNAWIILPGGRVVTRQVGQDILAGITRDVLITLLGEQNLQLEERPFSVAEAQAALEAFNTSATGTVMPVVAIDGLPIGLGKPGPIATALRAAYHSKAHWHAL
jgi:D-alanine transaminase